MSPAHVWACGQCGAHVVARVGAIARTFQAHLRQCPALARRQPSAAAPRPAPRGPRASRVGAKAAPPTLRAGGP
jgi:hypothetical protein